MGIAYSVGLILIYLLVVAQFRSYMVPLIIMAPIPLTVIGVMPGHALMNAFFMDAKFTATSMIGMIALAGIIVRNSILLVDFINEEIRRGVEVTEAVVRGRGPCQADRADRTCGGMLGAGFIIDDPIFSGLAVSLIFGILRLHVADAGDHPDPVLPVRPQPGGTDQGAGGLIRSRFTAATRAAVDRRR
jgi:hypothetical protein